MILIISEWLLRHYDIGIKLTIEICLKIHSRSNDFGLQILDILFNLQDFPPQLPEILHAQEQCQQLEQTVNLKTQCLWPWQTPEWRHEKQVEDGSRMKRNRNKNKPVHVALGDSVWRLPSVERQKGGQRLFGLTVSYSAAPQTHLKFPSSSPSSSLSLFPSHLFLIEYCLP